MRRMMVPEVIIKSQVADDTFSVDLNEIVEKYGTVIDNGYKTITLQIYNKEAADDGSHNELVTDNGYIGFVIVNGTITITKNSDDVFIQGMLFDTDMFFTQYLYIPSGSYENGITLGSGFEFDLYVIRV